MKNPLSKSCCSLFFNLISCNCGNYFRNPWTFRGFLLLLCSVLFSLWHFKLPVRGNRQERSFVSVFLLRSEHARVISCVISSPSLPVWHEDTSAWNDAFKAQGWTRTLDNQGLNCDCCQNKLHFILICWYMQWQIRNREI